MLRQRWTKSGRSLKNASMTYGRSKEQEGRVIQEAQKEQIIVHFATLMDISVFSRMRSWRPKYQKYKGRIVLRDDIVTDDSGSHAVFTEQGSSASQMTAAKVMDDIAKRPGCAGQAADAVSACTQVKMEDASALSKLPKSKCPDIWIRLPRNKRSTSWANIKEAVIPLERNLYGHPLAGLLWERQK